jgi:hypothetical protein
MWYHNRGVAHYFRAYANKSEEESELTLALEDFKTALNSDEFDTPADSHAFIAQVCLYLLYFFTIDDHEHSMK